MDSSINPLVFFFFFFSCLLSYCSSSYADVVDESRNFHTITIGSMPPSTCTPSSTASAGGGGDGGRLKITHRHGPCSARPHRHTSHPHLHLRRDKLRVDSLHRKISAPATTSPSSISIPARSGASLGVLDYVVTISLGTPTQHFTVIFDTGSDISWVQCKPCSVSCYPQTDPLFDPSLSSTYSNVTCASADCPLVGRCDEDDSTCIYGVKYGDSSYSAGQFATETLTLTPSDRINSFQFGCAEMSRGLVGVAGILGLGRSKVSLASQYGAGGAFSYCLPSSLSSTGHLSFASSTEQAQPNKFEYTPMLTKPIAPTLYFVEMVSISVAGETVPIPPGVFSGGAGTIIDSGTVVTRLPMEAYVALRDEFRRRMDGYPAAPPLGELLDTCYDFTGLETVTVPAVAMVFGGGAVLDVVKEGILYMAEAAQACLAFAGNGDDGMMGIVGNMQQRGHEVVYDVGKGVVGFGPGGCN